MQLNQIVRPCMLFSLDNSQYYRETRLLGTVEAPVSGHPREAENVSATGAARLWECVNTEFV